MNGLSFIYKHVILIDLSNIYIYIFDRSRIVLYFIFAQIFLRIDTKCGGCISFDISVKTEMVEKR